MNKLWLERERLIQKIKDIGLKGLDSSTPFFLIEVENATETSQKLLNVGIVVRDCTSFGLPNHIRVSPQSEQEGDMLIKALSNEPFSNLSHDGKIQLVLGGARSGKSEYAEQLVLDLGGSEDL